LRNGHEIQGFEQKILRKIYGPKKAELSEKFRTLSLSDNRVRISYRSSSVFTIVKPTERETRNTYGILVENTSSKKRAEEIAGYY
jgi:hypothetical protein